MSSPHPITTLLLSLSLLCLSAVNSTVTDLLRRPSHGGGSLCHQLIAPAGYSCSEHTVQTKDGYLLALQRVSSPSFDHLQLRRFPPVLLIHGLFMAGDAWFLNPKEQSLGFLLADRGFDVWIANVRGTRWSHGHVSLSDRSKAFWDWSWEDLALYDLPAMIEYIYQLTNSKVFLVGHSQGTIMSLAAITQTDIVEMVEAAALLSPISYLDHINAPFVLRMVNINLDKMILAMGFHQLNFRSDMGIQLLDSLCDGHLDCVDMLGSITGKNCCFNTSRVEYYLEYEPHPSSVKNLNHLFQMIRKGTFARYDYGMLKNKRVYGFLKPPPFDLELVPESLPLWMAYGGTDDLADVIDVQRTIRELPCKKEVLYLDNYGHVDFLLSVKAKEDVYEHMIDFFSSLGKSSSL
ncbi:triacylglycerol lipase 1-like [Silene latifolia]|uniref:triacylglycerol lipase 1-like n=1 Tax=Silene latifolia TaxID=37657 RepID=UPI003D771327